MGCIKLYNKEYKGDIIMGRGTNRQRQQTGNSQSNVPPSTNTTSEDVSVAKSTLAILIFLATTIIGLLGWILIEFYNSNGENKVTFAQIQSIKDEIQSIKDDTTLLDKINKTEKEVENINNILNGNTNSDSEKGLRTRMAIIEELLNLGVISASPDIFTSIDNPSIEPNNTNLVGTSFSPDTCIGTDTEGNQHYAKDNINKKILLTYTENENEVYFLGQYNENYHWDGYCVTNEYRSDGTLIGICESNFEDGKRLDYKSFCISDNNEWVYSNKICNENDNSGTNISYSLVYDKIKNFTITNVRAYDILYTDKFLETVEPVMLKYYYGKTLDEKYEDESGQAYMAKYNTDGTVKTLYRGKFEKGEFKDYTGNAWDIAYDSESNSYIYNVGNFEKDHAIPGLCTSTPVNIDEINEIISKYDFDCELKWKQN